MLPSRSVILAKEICTTIRVKFNVPLIYFFYLHTTIWQKCMFLFHLIFLLYTTIRPKIRFLIDLFLSCAHNHSTKIYVQFSFIFSFVHDHSTKTCGTHRYISFICTRPFDKNIWSSFIYSFFSVITIRPTIRVYIDLFILFVHDHST